MTSDPNLPHPQSSSRRSFDPATVPVHHAATVMLIDDRPDLHVLLVHRTAKVVFAPDSWVFPGGRVDAGDDLGDFDSICHGLSDAAASRILGVERGGLAWWIAACRETLEEAGLLLTRNPVNPATVAAIRQRVLGNESAFAPSLHEMRLKLDLRSMEEVARFVTPLGAPRRFDARFFVARSPTGQEPSDDQGEIVNWEWVRPSEALERRARGNIQMMSPTIRMVACLARFRSADQVMAVAKERLEYQRVRVDDPHGDYRVLLPGEPGYESADLEVESGWVRLWEPSLG